MAKKGLQWTPRQQEIAGLFELGQTPAQLKAMGIGTELIYKVKNALAAGERPPEPNYDNIKVEGEVEEGEKEEGNAGSGDNGEKPRNSGVVTRGVALGNASVIKLVPKVFTCDYTPIMRSARDAAIVEWEWDPNMKFEDFLDTILHTFFKDRGLVLAGYTKITNAEEGEEEPFHGS